MGFRAKIFLHILVVILVSCCVKAEEKKWETDEQSVEGAPEPPGRSEETENDSYGETSHGYRDMFMFMFMYLQSTHSDTSIYLKL